MWLWVVTNEVIVLTDPILPKPNKPAFRFLGQSRQRVERQYQITNTQRFEVLSSKIFWLLLSHSHYYLCSLSPKMPQGTLEILLVSAKDLENTEFLCKPLSLFLYIIIADCYIFSGYMRNDIQKCFLAFHYI